MPMNEPLLAEFDRETAIARRMLERLPDDRLDYRPHPRSFTMRELATHIANLPTWTGLVLNAPGIDLASPQERPRPAASRAEVLARFDANVGTARAVLAAASDARMGEPWSLRSGAQVVFTQPRAAVLRAWVFSHLIHHRAQLGVYLRLNDLPVPATYGASADEPGR